MKNRNLGKLLKLTAITAVSACMMFGTAYADETTGTKTVYADDVFKGWSAGVDTEGGLKSMQWSGSYATWEKYGSVSSYQVILYRDGQKVVKKYIKSQTRINFDDYMRQSGTYTFTVQVETGWGWSKPYVSKARTSKDAAYAKQQGHTLSGTPATEEVSLDDPRVAVDGSTSEEETTAAAEPGTVETTAAAETAAEETTAAAETAAEETTAAAETTAEETAAETESAAAAGQWLQAADGSGKWWYRNEDGTWPALSWLEDNGKKYYFDSEGWMVTGTLEIDGTTCSFDESGAYIEQQ